MFAVIDGDHDQSIVIERQDWLYRDVDSIKVSNLDKEKIASENPLFHLNRHCQNFCEELTQSGI